MSDLNELARSMRDRMPWPVGRRILEENDVARGRGWDATLEKLNDDRVDRTDKIEPIEQSLREHILCGEKLVRMYQLEPLDLDAMWDTALELSVPKSLLKTRYPVLLAEEELSELPLGHTLIAVEEDEAGVSLLFSSIRQVSVRVPLQFTDFPEDVAEIVSRYDEIVGIKNRRVQGMDVVWIPRNGDLAEVRVDYPFGMLQPAGEYAHEAVRSKLHVLLDRDFLTNPVNLFPLISRMYADKGEGSVVELAFGTTTASLKHEKMRRGSMSLRNEKYHKGGLAALDGTISPFKISIEWERSVSEKLTSKPELNLHTTSYVSHSENPVLIDAVVRNCMGIDDFDFVRSRIISHLNALNEDLPAE